MEGKVGKAKEKIKHSCKELFNLHPCALKGGILLFVYIAVK